MLNNKSLTETESLCVGGITGAIEVTANLPLWTIKTRAQCDLPFTLNIYILYRGYIAALVVSTLLTSVQILTASLIEKNIHTDNLKDRHNQRIISAFLSGSFSALFFTPIDLIGTQYHKHAYCSFWKTTNETIKKVGTRGLFIGMPATAVAEGIFVCGFYGFYPLVRAIIDKLVHKNTYSAVIAATITGIGAATASHIPDMIKTMQQRDADIGHKSVRQCCYELATKKGGVGFFKGYLPRTLWMVSSVGIAGAVATETERLVMKARP